MSKLIRKLEVGVIAIILVITCIYYSLQFTSRLSESPQTLKSNQMKRKLILFTTQWWQSGKFPYLKEANAFCPKCFFTQDESLWEKSAAVVFHGRMLNRSIPKRKSWKQLWIFLQFETLNRNIKMEQEIYERMKLYDNLFNWTMTFRRDSDVFVPYGKFIQNRKTPKPKHNPTWAFMPGARLNATYHNYHYAVTPSLHNFKKRRTGAWITSRCNSHSQRESKISTLLKYLDIDIYGDGPCAQKKCFVPKWKALSGIDCRLQIHKNYKFYFAFENSLCEDYVTEKFFDTSALTEMIPVVYGGADYRAMFPKNSFINIMDFKSLKHLAEYLKYLSKNPKEWLKYFEWRKEFWVQTNRFVTGYCDLCKKLWDNDDKKQKDVQKIYKSAADWWIYGNSQDYKPVCSNPKSLIVKLAPYHRA